MLMFVFIMCHVTFNDANQDNLSRFLNLGNYNSVFNPLISMLIFCLCLCYEDSLNNLNNVISKVIATIGRVTLEIYLVGTIFLRIYIGSVNKLRVESDIRALILALIAWISSVIVALIINYIKNGVFKQLKMISVML